jgi:hypothetical protein
MRRIAGIAILLASSSFAPAAQEVEPPRRNLKELLSPTRKRAVVTALANEIGLVVISIGKDHGVVEADEFVLYRGGDFVAKIQINRADRKWSAGKITSKKTDPRVTDDVCSGSPYTDEQRKGLLEYAFSFRPLLDEDHSRVTAFLAELESDDIAARERATNELGKMGGSASAVLRSLDLVRMSAEARARVEDSLKELDRYNRMLQSPGLERDIEFLAVVDDARGYEGLKRILSGVGALSFAGFPEKGTGLSEYLMGWWAHSKNRVRWNLREDRFEEK